MILFRRFAASALVVAALLAVLPAAAFAAAPDTDMWGTGAIDMADLSPDLQPTYIISLQLKPKTKMPAKVAVPLPDGVEPIWVGEVFFGDPSQDTKAEDSKIVESGGRRYVTFTIQHSNAIQVECEPASGMIVNDANTRDVNLYWTAPKINGPVRLAIAVPAGYKAETVPDKAEAKKAEEGSAVVRDYKKTKDGQELKLAIKIVPGQPVYEGEDAEGSASATASEAATATTATQPATLVVAPVPTSGVSASTIVLGVLAVLLLGAVVLLVLALRKKPVE